MPLYMFVCTKCSKQQDIFMPSDDRNKYRQCYCGSTLKRIIGAPNVGRVYGSTFWSQSLAISPDQVDEHKKLFPDVKVRTDGCIGFDSVREHAEYCEKTGFEKMPQKKKTSSIKL
jgi:putative FmdB family regulatory protein